MDIPKNPPTNLIGMSTNFCFSRNIPLKDPTNVPDPYVKLYLLPGRSKESKRKTAVVKDNCMPEYDEQFEWVIPMAELHSRQLEVTVATHKGFLGGSPVIGQVSINNQLQTKLVNNIRRLFRKK